MLKPFDQLSLADYATMFDLNIRGYFLLTQAVLPHLPRKNADGTGGGGRIVNLCSGSARMPGVNQSLYAATKGAIESFSKGLAVELPAKVRSAPPRSSFVFGLLRGLIADLFFVGGSTAAPSTASRPASSRRRACALP